MQNAGWGQEGNGLALQTGKRLHKRSRFYKLRDKSLCRNIYQTALMKYVQTMAYKGAQVAFFFGRVRKTGGQGLAIAEHPEGLARTRIGLPVLLDALYGRLLMSSLYEKYLLAVTVKSAESEGIRQIELTVLSLSER